MSEKQKGKSEPSSVNNRPKAVRSTAGEAGQGERAKRAGAEPPSFNENGRQERWSARKKEQVVMRLLRGEDLDTVSRELGATVPDLAEWREDFLRGGREALKSRQGDPMERKLREAHAKIGDLMMRLELWEKRGSRHGMSRRSSP